MSQVVIPQLVEVKWRSKIIMIGHHIARTIVHYPASNIAEVFLDCTQGETRITSVSHPDIEKPWLDAMNAPHSVCSAPTTIPPALNIRATVAGEGATA